MTTPSSEQPHNETPKEFQPANNPDWVQSEWYQEWLKLAQHNEQTNSGSWVWSRW